MASGSQRLGYELAAQPLQLLAIYGLFRVLQYDVDNRSFKRQSVRNPSGTHSLQHPTRYAKYTMRVLER